MFFSTLFVSAGDMVIRDNSFVLEELFSLIAFTCYLHHQTGFIPGLKPDLVSKNLGVEDRDLVASSNIGAGHLLWVKW